MKQKQSAGTVCRPARLSFPLDRFLEKLRQSIGGPGDLFLGSSECSTLSVEDFRSRYLWHNIVKKYDDGKASDEKSSAAIKALLDAERKCASAPYEFSRDRNLHSRPALSAVTTADAIMMTAARKIGSVLGDFLWVDALDYVGFGPGATTNLRRQEADLWFKFGVVPQASTSCVPLVRAYLGRRNALWKRTLLGKAGAAYSICDSNTVTTVPKNSVTDRPIAIEPQWNMFFQKGIGGLIRRRLKTVGVDLNSQKWNRDRALEGSRDGLTATIDLSSASDTVSRWLVHELLPPDWVTAMERCRSPYSVLPSGERILLRKFSSMGNGFTFELESLIFWAISSTIVQFVRKDWKLKDHRVSIYGDDIVVPVDCYEPVMDALTLLGFSVNADKSYGHGPFRESCGMHAFKGHDVSPFFIRSPIVGLPQLFLLHNNLVRWSMRRYNAVRDARVQELCRWVRNFAPPEWRRPRLPDGVGDTAFIGSFDECRPHLFRERTRDRRKPNIQSPVFRIPVLAPAPRRYSSSQRAQWAIEKGYEPAYEGQNRLLRTLWLLRDKHVDSNMVSRSNLVNSRDFLRVPYIRSDIKYHIAIDRGEYSVQEILVTRWNDIGPWIDFQDDSYDETVVNDGEVESSL